MKKRYFHSSVSPYIKQKNKGFSLVELIIVIAIMAILAAAIAPALIRYINKSRRTKDIETASVIMGAVNTAYGEAYSFEGEEDGVQQNADQIEGDIKTVTVNSSEGSYSLEVISVASGDDIFSSSVDEHQHFLDLIRKNLGKESNNGTDFSTPKFKGDSGNGVPAGFLIGRKLDGSFNGERFEVWLSDDSNEPIYRLNPDACSEYK